MDIQNAAAKIQNRCQQGASISDIVEILENILEAERTADALHALSKAENFRQGGATVWAELGMGNGSEHGAYHQLSSLFEITIP